MFVILLSFAFLGASLAIPNLRHFQLSFSSHFGWFHKVLSEDSDWFHHQWFFGHNDMVIFFFSSSFLCNFCLFLQQFLIWGIFQFHFFFILGEFMRYLAKVFRHSWQFFLQFSLIHVFDLFYHMLSSYIAWQLILNNS